MLSVFILSILISYIVQSQTIHPAVTYKRTLGSDFYGTNIANIIRPNVSEYDTDVIKNVPALKPMTIRFPGGDAANWYNWHTGWFVSSPALPSKYVGLPVKANTLENFLPLLDSCHATPIFMLNILTDSLSSQLAFLQHAASLGMPVKYVELGSELYPGQTDDDTLESQVFPDAHVYGLVANRWIDTLKKYFPGAKFSVPATFNTYGSSAPPALVQWNDTLLKYAHDADAISIHPYMDAEDPQADTTQIKEYPKDINSFLYQPFYMYILMEGVSAKAALFNKEIWNTEYNLSDQTRQVHGMWAQGLFIATQTLEMLNDPRVTHTAAYSNDGTGVHGLLFYDNQGFSFGGDGLYLAPYPPPPTVPWSLTCAGNTMSYLGMAMHNSKYASPLAFSPVLNISYLNPLNSYNTYSTLYGWFFSTDTNSSAIIMNYDSLPHSLSTTELWPDGGTYQQHSAYALHYVAGPADVTTLNPKSMPGTITLPGYSITYITSNDLPAAPPPNIHISANQTAFCSGGSASLSVPSGYYKYLWSTGATSKSITVSTQGEYWVRVWAVNNGYYATDSTFITVHGLPKKPNIGQSGSITFCLGGSVNLLNNSNNLGNVSYLWNDGETSQQITVSNSGSYYMFDIDSNGCKNVSDTIAVTVYPLPTATIRALGPTSFCYNQSVQLVATVGLNNYSWSNGQHGHSQDTISVSAPGTYTCTVTDYNGCTATSSPSPSITVWTMHTPVVLASGSLTFCPEANIYLYPDSSYTTYQWVKATTNILGAVSRNYYPTQTGSYKVVVTESHGCSATSGSVNVTINNDPAPNISVSGGTVLCQGSTSTLSASQTFPHYLWSTGATTQSINVNNSGNYTVTVTDGNGCVGTSALKAIIVNPLPNPVITLQGPTSFCSGGSVTLDAGLYSKYAWSSGKTTETISASTQGSYNVMVTDVNGCQNTSPSVNVTVYPLPNPNITPGGATTFCSGGSVTLSAPLSSSYQWIQGTTSINGATKQTYSASSVGTYKVTVTDQNHCVGTSSNGIPISVNNNPNPSVTVTGSTAFCQGGSATLKCSNTYNAYLWTNGSTSQSIVVSTAGNYSVTVTDGNGCHGTSTTKAIIVNALPNPVINPQGSTSFCNGGSVTLDAGAAYTKYSWSNGKTTETISATTQGPYNVTVTDANSCVNTSPSVSVTVFTVPNPTINANGPVTFCAGGSVVLSTLSGYNKYQWNNGNNINGATQQSYAATSGATYKVTITDGNGCSATTLSGTKVTVNSLPAASISYSGTTNICSGKTYTIKAKTATGNIYQWYKNGNRISGATSSSLVVSQAGDYYYFVTNSDGCTNTSNTITFTANCRDENIVQNTIPPNSLMVYPNPSTGDAIHIDLKLGDNSDQQCLLEVRNAFGEQILQRVLTTSQGLASYEWIPDGTISAGLYLVIVHTSNQTYHSKLIIGQ